MAALATEAPNLQILFRTPDPGKIPGLMPSGELDLAIGYLPEASEQLIKRTVFREPFVCVARRGHPVLHDGNLPLDRYVELQHVQVLPGECTQPRSTRRSPP
jgi:DNA-binding transcriptional LysR family regulator